MNKIRKTLGQLFSAQADDSAEEQQKGADSTGTEQKVDQKEDAADDGQQEQEGEMEEDEQNGQEGKSSAAGTVTLALEDYDKLVALASETKTTRKANAALKAKADKWDEYQAALVGGKPASDSAGSKAEADQEATPTDEYAELRKKHGKLMDDV